MKRDMDMVRELLLRIESLHLPAGSADFLSAREEPLAHSNDDPDSIAYHMRLLIAAGLIDPTKTQGADSFGVRGLTWAGHDLLDSIRDPAIWKQTKEGAEKAGGFTVDLLGELAKGLIKTQIEKYTGIKL
jgi:hypothetical protein